MFKISVLDYRFQPSAQKAVQKMASNDVVFHNDRCPESERIQRTGDAEIALITPWEKIDKEYLNACPNLKYIGLCGTSTANIELEELNKRDIAFSNIVSNNPKVAVAEFFFMLLVELARGTGKYQWRAGEERTLTRKKLGIIGLGAVGKGFAQVAAAYDMEVSYFSPNRKHDWEEKGVDYLNKSELLSNSDVIVLSAATNVVVLDQHEFNSLKNGSIIVQASGGSPFDKSAFFDWISNRENFAVFDMSAGVKNYELYKDNSNIIFSRLVAGDTFESNSRRGERAIENLKYFLDNYDHAK